MGGVERFAWEKCLMDVGSQACSDAVGKVATPRPFTERAIDYEQDMDVTLTSRGRAPQTGHPQGAPITTLSRNQVEQIGKVVGRTLCGEYSEPCACRKNTSTQPIGMAVSTGVDRCGEQGKVVTGCAAAGVIDGRRVLLQPGQLLVRGQLVADAV